MTANALVSALVPILTPHGRLLLAADQDAPALAEPLLQRLTQSFARGTGHGLLQLGASEVGTVLPAAFGTCVGSWRMENRMSEIPDNIDWSLTSWEGSRRAQLR